MSKALDFWGRSGVNKFKPVALFVALVTLGFSQPALAENSLTPRPKLQKPASSIIGPGHDRRHIQVKFRDEIDVALGPGGYPVASTFSLLGISTSAGKLLASLTDAGGEWRRTMGASEQILDSLRARAQNTLGQQIADLNNYFILTVPASARTEEWIDRLNALPEVEMAASLSLPPPSPVPPDFQSLQGYLNPAPAGIDAYYAWPQPGGTGTNVTVCDLEYSWNLSHQDLPVAITTWIPPGYTAQDPFLDQHHGTAVLGEIASLSNGWGTTGAAYGASVKVAPVYLNDGGGPLWLVATALSHAMSNLSAGDIILIEQQTYGPNYAGNGQFGLVPVEWEQPIYNAIMTAVGNGIHVVEAAGNGAENLDHPVYSTGNGGHWPFLSANNSGAIIVGAGKAGGTGDRSKLYFSNYGSRVDLQGWGEKVTTTGYGDYYLAEGYFLFYTDGFGGTSSASPIVASAAALLESYYEQANATEMPPADLRTHLIATGTPQTGPGHIGPRPNLKWALQGCVALPGDANASGNYSLSDVISSVNYVFSRTGCSPLPQCWLTGLLCRGDWDGSGTVSLSDVIRAVNFIFAKPGGPWNALPVGSCCQTLP